MKRILAVILIVGLVACLSAVTALADDPAYNFNVSGVMQVSEGSTVSGTLTDDPDTPTITLIVSGTITDFADHTATLTGTVDGDIKGDLKAAIDDNGVAALSGEIIGTDVRLWITGVFPKSFEDGQFVGRVSAAPAAAYVTGITVDTATGDNTVEVGKTLQMAARVEPSGASDKVAWSVRTVDGSGAAEIDAETGLLTGKHAGIVTVTAKALDGSLKYAEMQVNVTEASMVSGLENEPSVVDPTYTIVIPGTVDFGKLQKGTGVSTQPFVIEAKDVQIDDGGGIQVRVSSTFKMSYKGQHLGYFLRNHEKAVSDGGLFALFKQNDKEKGSVGVNTADITHSGNYTGIMTFTIAMKNDGVRYNGKIQQDTLEE